MVASADTPMRGENPVKYELLARTHAQPLCTVVCGAFPIFCSLISVMRRPPVYPGLHLRTRCRHGQRRSGLHQFGRLTPRCQQPIVANPFDSLGQDVQHKAAYKLHAVQTYPTFAALIVTAHLENHLLRAYAVNAFI
jgi:hypothetical protein